jgi:hypothetical protein
VGKFLPRHDKIIIWQDSLLLHPTNQYSDVRRIRTSQLPKPMQRLQVFQYRRYGGKKK